MRRILAFALSSLMAAPLFCSTIFAQGSITGTVSNSDLSTPEDGSISFFGLLDDTDEEIRLESSVGAGYVSGNWYDDFQNYQTEVAGNPYDYYFVNTANGEAFHLAGTIPSNSFQIENITLASATVPATPTNLAAEVISVSSVSVTWSGSPGLTYHVYRRNAVSSGSFFRVDDPSGSLANSGVSTEDYVDNTVDGVSSYDYVLIAENSIGDYSAHSAVVTVTYAGNQSPVVDSVVGPVTVPEGGSIQLIMYASDIDLDVLTTSVANNPNNSSFSDNNNGTGTLTFNPDFTQAGVYSIDFIASDGEAADTQTITIDVTELAYLCGDANASGAIDIDDVIYLVSYVFQSGPAPAPPNSGDVNCAAGIDIDDIVYLIAYIFGGARAPCDPNGDGQPDC